MENSPPASPPFPPLGQENGDPLDFEEVEEEYADDAPTAGAADKKEKGSYAGIHSSGFRDFLLKPELLRAIGDCGFEHPSEVQQECIPQAMLGMDVICQAKSGMGKTAVFVIATLQQLVPVDGEVSVLVMCHTRELADQIATEYTRFTKYFDPPVRVAHFYGGMPKQNDIKTLKEDCPHIVVGTPGRTLDLVNDGHLKLDNCKHFVLDECDKMLDSGASPPPPTHLPPACLSPPAVRERPPRCQARRPSWRPSCRHRHVHRSQRFAGTARRSTSPTVPGNPRR